MQQQELAQMRQRDANLTALAAIGPRKKRKVDSPGAPTTGSEVKKLAAGIYVLFSLFISYSNKSVVEGFIPTAYFYRSMYCGCDENFIQL